MSHGARRPGPERARRPPRTVPTGRPLPDFPEPAPLAQPRQRHRDLDVQPEGRRRQDHDDDQPGRRLAEYGRRVLLVDFDPQASLTVGLGLNPNDLDTTIYHLMMEQRHPDRRGRSCRPASRAST